MLGLGTEFTVWRKVDVKKIYGCTGLEATPMLLLPHPVR